MSRVIIKFNSLNQEISRVLSALSNFGFYKKNNYHISLPLGIANLSKQEIEKKVTVEYKSDKYQEEIRALGNDWKKMETDFFVKAKDVLKIKPLPKYDCFITKYGTGGSYNPPNIVIMNINSQNFGVYTIPHEIIHLMIHDLIEKYKILHWVKERLVDLYLYDITGVKIFQPIMDRVLVDKVDEIFNKYKAEGAQKIIENLKLT